MTEQTKQKLKYWLLGLFTGGAVAAPVTVFVTKRIYENKMQTAVAKASEEGETRGMNAMAEYAISQQATVKEAEGTQEVPDEEDINNYDVTIDDEEATEDIRERTEAHERYLDMIDKYSGDSVLSPYIIDSDKFTNEQYMEKSYVDWYEEDNVFEEDLRVIEDPFATFGVTDGSELFKDADLRTDPDICYVRDERNTIDYEISRIHGSYAKIVGGEGSLGETDT